MKLVITNVIHTEWTEEPLALRCRQIFVEHSAVHKRYFIPCVFKRYRLFSRKRVKAMWNNVPTDNSCLYTEALIQYSLTVIIDCYSFRNTFTALKQIANSHKSQYVRLQFVEWSFFWTFVTFYRIFFWVNIARINDCYRSCAGVQYESKTTRFRTISPRQMGF